MIKIIFILTALSISSIARSTDAADITEFEKLYRCAQKNSSCGGKLAVQIGVVD